MTMRIKITNEDETKTLEVHSTDGMTVTPVPPLESYSVHIHAGFSVTLKEKQS